MNNLYDVLEICLQELENGADLESVLMRYPDLANELRPILKASIMARTMSVSAPSPDAVRRGRAKLLQHAAQLREAKVAPRSKRMIPFFQRLAISFALTALLLSSGTGLVSASSSALPGENLYPVKLTWENVRLFFSFSPESHEALEHAFENERLHEVNELLVEGRHETIRFAGVYIEVSDIKYVSGIHIVILDTSIIPTEPLLNGMAVEVTGHTNAEGFVDIESITLLPAGSVVPVGPPVEIKDENNDNENSSNTNTGKDSEKSTDNDDLNSNDDNVNDSDDNENNSNSNSDNSSGDDNSDDGSEDKSNEDNSNDDNSGDDSNSDSDSNSDKDKSGDSGGDDSKDSDSD
jgi:hypothetical protein